MRRFQIAILALAGFELSLIGVAYLLVPQWMYDFFGLTIRSPDEFNVVRSGPGAVFLMSALVFLAGAVFASYRRFALHACFLFFASLLFGRAVSVVLDGLPTAPLWFVATVELVTLAAVIWVISKSGGFRRVFTADP